MIDKVKAGPVELGERIGSVDVLRGFAVLGILIMNIQKYSMVSAAYFNPTAYGNLTGTNWLVWLCSHLFADMKFISLFSLLFGAGILLFTGKAEAKGVKAAGLHYRRAFWLLVFGMLHGYCLWSGDILFAYAICAFLVFLFRDCSPRKLLILGLLSVSVSSVIYLGCGLAMPHMPPEYVEGMSREWWAPDDDQIDLEVAAYRGSYREQMTHRVPSTLVMQTLVFLIYILWRCAGLMLVGMALLKWGILSARRSNRFYLLMVCIGFVIGIPLILYGVHLHVEHGWAYTYSFFLGTQFNYWGSLFMACAYIGAIMLAVRLTENPRILAPLAAAGRMAFTNYILQTVICTTLFYGHGFGLFGSVERTGQILIVFGIWIFEVLLSLLWLSHYRFGPFEWLWRSLTYWKFQPMRRS